MLTAAFAVVMRPRGPRPSMDIPLTALGSLPDGFSFSRASSAWCFDSMQKLVQVASNVPRFAYDQAMGTALGYLNEGQRQQRLQHSRDFTQAVWVKTGCAVVANAVGIDGVGNSAATITASTANATLIQSQTLSSALRAGSIFIKRVNGTGGVDMTLDGGASWFDVGLLTSDVWARPQIAQTLANPGFGLRLQTAGDAVIVDQAQLEDGGFMTSPIISAGTVPVTRAADMASLAVGEWFNHAEGTLYVETTAPAGVETSATATVIGIDSGSTANRHFIGRGTTRGARGLTTTASVVTGDCAGAVWSDQTIGKGAFAYRDNDFAFAWNGGAVTTDTSGSVPVSGLTTLRLGPTSGGTYAHGYVARVAYFPNRLDNAVLQEITR